MVVRSKQDNRRANGLQMVSTAANGKETKVSRVCLLISAPLLLTSFHRCPFFLLGDEESFPLITYSYS